MPVQQEVAATQPPGVEPEDAPSSAPVVGIIYPPPEVRSKYSCLHPNCCYTRIVLLKLVINKISKFIEFFSCILYIVHYVD